MVEDSPTEHILEASALIHSKDTESPHSSSKTGENVQLGRVLIMLPLLIFLVICLEQIVRLLENKVGPYPKYHEMLRKVYRELMILGFISIGVKFAEGLGIISEENQNLLAFESADTTIFVVALVLVFQATRIFQWLRKANHRMDRDEMFTAQDILEMYTEQKSSERCNFSVRSCLEFACERKESGNYISPQRFARMVQMRTHRHFFLRMYGLPQVFPFAKYLKRVQDNQIGHLIEVELSTWLLLLLLLFVVEIGTRELELKDHLSASSALLNAFSVVAWLIFVAHFIALQFLSFALAQMNHAAGFESRLGMEEWLNELVAIERQYHVAEREVGKMVEAMQVVEEEQEALYLNRGNVWRSSMWELLYFACGKKKDSDKTLNDLTSCSTYAMEDSPPRPELAIKWFHPAVWHYIVKILLMVNGFFSALFFQSILHQLIKDYSVIGLSAFMIPLPLAINMLLIQPSMFRHLILVSSVFEVDLIALSKVTNEFSEMVAVRVEFLKCLRNCLMENNLNINDVQLAFRQLDPNQTGLVSIYSLRKLLCCYGLRYSTLRFKRLAKILFRVHKEQVEYLIVERLLQLVQEGEDRIFASHSGSDIPCPREDLLSMHYQYQTCVIMEEEEARVSRHRSVHLDPHRFVDSGDRRISKDQIVMLDERELDQTDNSLNACYGQYPSTSKAVR